MNALSRRVFLAGWLAVGCLHVGIPTALAQPQDSKTIDAGRIRLSIELSELGGFRLAELVDKASGYRFDAGRSLLWQANLRNADRPQQYPLGLSVPRDQQQMQAATCRWGDCSAKQLELIYENIPVADRSGQSGTAQTLQATLRVRVRDSDGKLVWSCRSELLGRGSFVIHDMKFPLLALGPIGGRSEDDQLILPAWGGLYVPDPIRTGNSQDDESPRLGDNSRDSLTYPGYVESQFLAYCDPAEGSDKQRTGLWMACEDRLGFTKRLMFQSDPDRRQIRLFFRHFNYAPYSTTRTEVVRNLQSFDLVTKFSYEVAMDSFQGDWVDASAMYRQWLEASKPVFAQRGTLRDRDDMPRRVKESHVVIGYLPNKTPNTPITADLYRSDSDLSKIKRMMEFLSFNGRKEIGVDVGFGGGTKENPSRPGNYGGIGGDAFPPKLHRPGMPSLIKGLHQLGANTIVFNRDIGNWQMQRDPELDKLALSKGLVINFDGTLYGKPQPNFSVSCGASQWINEARIPTTVNFVESSRVAGQYGYNDGILSGKGPGSRLCWAGLHPDTTDLTAHRHTVGGGNDWVVALRKLAGDMQKAIGPLYWPTGERGHEQQVDWSRLGGRHRYWPWDVTFPGTAGQWIEGAQPVPIRAYLFHHYCPLGSMGLPRTVMVRTYHRDTQLADLRPDQLESARWRFRYASVLESGERLGLFVAAGGPVARDLDKRLDGTIDDVFPALQDDLQFFRRLIRLRAVAKDLLVYGRMERPPNVQCASTTMQFLGIEGRRPKPYSVEIPAIVASAWIDQHRPGFVFINHTDKPQSFQFSFNADEMGLSEQATYSWEQTEQWMWRDTELTLNRSDHPRWQSSQIMIPAGDAIALRLARD